MAISNTEDLRNRVLQLFPKDSSHDLRKVSKTIWSEMKAGGIDQMSNAELAQTLREAYDEPFWTERYVVEIKERFNLS